MVRIVLPFVTISLLGAAFFGLSAAAQSIQGTHSNQESPGGQPAFGFEFELCSIRFRGGQQAAAGISLPRRTAFG